MPSSLALFGHSLSARVIYQSKIIQVINLKFPDKHFFKDTPHPFPSNFLMLRKLLACPQSPCHPSLSEDPEAKTLAPRNMQRNGNRINQL